MTYFRQTFLNTRSGYGVECRTETKLCQFSAGRDPGHPPAICSSCRWCCKTKQNRPRTEQRGKGAKNKSLARSHDAAKLSSMSSVVVDSAGRSTRTKYTKYPSIRHWTLDWGMKYGIASLKSPPCYSYHSYTRSLVMFYSMGRIVTQPDCWRYCRTWYVPYVLYRTYSRFNVPLVLVSPSFPSSYWLRCCGSTSAGISYGSDVFPVDIRRVCAVWSSS